MPRFVAALVRHGAYEQPPGVPSAHLPHPLTAEGHEQAIAAAVELAADSVRWGVHIHETIYCSRLLRAWQTAITLRDKLGAEIGRSCGVVERSALDERCVGSAANLTTDEIAALVDRDPRYPPLPRGWKSHPTFRLPVPGAESLAQAGARVAAFIESIGASSRERGEMVVLVGHGAAFRHGARALGVLDRSQVSALSMFYARPVYLERDRSGWVHLGGDWKVRPRGGPDPVD